MLYKYTILTPYTSSRPIRPFLKYSLIVPDVRTLSIKLKIAFSIF